jgi:UDP-N-acetylmuramoylalanine--D-glutamate ligase
VQVGRLVIAGTDICGVDEIRLRGEHNLGNICAAVTATWELVRQNPDPVRRAVKSFAGLSHRLELVLKQDGVQYYDDSYSTTPETVIAAIRAFTEPKVLILEGADKYSDWHDLAREVVDGNVRHVVLAGDQTGQVAAALRSAGFGRAISGPRTMAEIVGSARALAQPGDIVLWSPACETLGRYQNLADRGEQFQAAVKELK